MSDSFQHFLASDPSIEADSDPNVIESDSETTVEDPLTGEVEGGEKDHSLYEPDTFFITGGTEVENTEDLTIAEIEGGGGTVSDDPLAGLDDIYQTVDDAETQINLAAEDVRDAAEDASDFAPVIGGIGGLLVLGLVAIFALGQFAKGAGEGLVS